MIEAQRLLRVEPLFLSTFLAARAISRERAKNTHAPEILRGDPDLSGC